MQERALTFVSHLVSRIKDGSKTCTYRMFDWRHLQVGEEIELGDSDTNEAFAVAKILSIKDTQLNQLTDEDLVGHEPIPKTTEGRVEHYKQFYGDRVTANTPMKIIRFKILKFL